MGRPKSPRHQYSKRPTTPRQPPHHKSSRCTSPRTRNRGRRRTLNPINLRCQNKIALRQPINLVRPRGNFRLPPPQQNIRMMPLLLGNRPHLIHKRQRLLEIRKRKRPHNVMPVHHLPLRHFFRQRLQFFPGQRRHSAAARHASLLRKLAHKSPLRNSRSTPILQESRSRSLSCRKPATTRKSRDGISSTHSAILLRAVTPEPPLTRLVVNFAAVRTYNAR